MLIDVERLIADAKERNSQQYSEEGSVINNNFIMMTENEANVFYDYLTKSKNYLEFGSGGSTIVALSTTNIENIISIECSKSWFDEMLLKQEIKSACESGRLKLLYADIGETREYAKPVANEFNDKWQNSHLVLFDNYPEYRPDTVLVDGRFRVACTLSTILYLRSCVKHIIIHDFWSREYYHDVLKYLDVIDASDNIAVFTIKDSIDMSELVADYEKHIHNYR